MFNLKHNPIINSAFALSGKLVNTISTPDPGIIILIYHSVATEGSVVSIPPHVFDEQIKWLADHYRIISLDEALMVNSLTEDVVVLTFDDGYKDYLTNAFPILEKYCVPSTVYVVTELVMNSKKMYKINAGIGKISLELSDLEQLADEDLVTIGSHTHTHLRLTNLSGTAIDEELKTSAKLLKKILNKNKIHFAYPWAEYNERTTELVKKYYESAVIGKGKKNNLPLDPFQLMRIPVINEPFRLFKERVKGNFVIKSMFRDWVAGQ